jgi:hypothetical protein
MLDAEMRPSVYVDVFTLQAAGGVDVGCRHGGVLASCNTTCSVQFSAPQHFNKPELRIRFLSSVFSVTVEENKKKKNNNNNNYDDDDDNNNNNNNKSTPCSKILLQKKMFLC